MTSSSLFGTPYIPQSGQGGPLPSTDFLVDVGFGLYPNISRVTALGHNENIDSGVLPVDVWTGGGLYQWMSGATSLEILSSSASDASDGIGARTVTVIGLDTNYNVITTTVALNGITPVALPIQFFRINLVRVATSGTSNVNVGALSIRDVVGSVLRAHISIGKSVSQQSAYTVPAGYRLQIFQLFAASNRFQAGGQPHFYTMAAVHKDQNGTEFISIEGGLTDAPFNFELMPGLILTEKTSFVLRVVAVAATGYNITGGWFGVLTLV